MRRLILLILLLATAALSESREVWQTGKVYPKVACAADPNQTYALYLPTSYRDGKPAPIVFIFEPLARGPVPVKIAQEAAEKYGYILLASNNSRNGPFGPQIEAAQAMWKDAHERFSIDAKRTYLAGFSGGSRMAVMFASRCDGCAAGVLASGAAFTSGLDPKSAAKFHYFGAIGYEDFNFPEYLQFEPKLKEAAWTYHIRRFNGPHEWAPAEVWLEAFEWFNLQAIKTGTLTRNEKFVTDAYASALMRAAAQSNDLERYRVYSQASADFAGLTDVAEATKQAAALENSKPVKELTKRERRDSEDQQRLAGQITSALEGLKDPDTRTEAAHQLRDLFDNLRTMAKNSKNPQQQVVAKRALMQEFIYAYETGEDLIRRKDYVNALLLYDTIVANAKAAPGAHLQKSRIYLLMGDKKKALTEARLAVNSGINDPENFNEPEFTALRSDPEFQALIDSLHPTKAE